MDVWVVALVPVGVTLCVLCIREPMRLALPLYAATIPFGDALSVSDSRYGSASSLLGVLLGAGLLAQLVTTRRTARRLDAQVPVWLLFLGLVMATALWTVNQSATLAGVGVLASLILVFVLAAVTPADRTVVRRLEAGLILGGISAVVYGTAQLIVLGGFGATSGNDVQDGSRFGDDMLGPNILSVTLLIPLALAAYRATASASGRLRAAHAAAAVVLVVGVLMTGSRTGTAGALAVLLVLILTGPRQAVPALSGALLASGLVGAIVWVYHPWGLAERTFESATSTSGRLDIWRVGWAACAEYCSYGSGWGTFPDVYVRKLAAVPGARVLTGSDTGAYEAHNVWLLALVETGVLGAVLLTAGLVVALWRANRLPARDRSVALAMMVGLLIGLVFLSSIEFKIFWIVPLLISLYSQVSDQEAGRAPLADPRTSRLGRSKAAGLPDVTDDRLGRRP